MYAVILSMIAGALSLYYFFKDLTFFKKYGIPYKTPMGFLGNMVPLLFHRQSISEFITSAYDIHPDAKYVGVYEFNHPRILIRDLELIKSITLKHFDNFMDHYGFVSEDQDPLFGRNIFILRGERWREVRSILSPAFTTSKMKSMFKLMSDCGVNFATYLAQLPAKSKSMEMKDVFSRYTNDVIATCAFGVTIDSMRDPKNEFYVYGKEMTAANSVILLKAYTFRLLPWLARMLRLKLFPERISIFFRNLIEKIIRMREENGIIRPDIMQLMMESRSKNGQTILTIDDIVSQAFLFFFGGFENPSSMMCFTAYEIATHPDIHETLQNEIDRVLEATDGQISYEAIENMEYLNAVLYEALRMYPIGTMLDRLCVKDFELPPTLPGSNSFTMKKGQSLWVPVYALHHDPKYFEEPKRFDPSRFLGERKRNTLNCGAYLPFGMGPRMCIGNRFSLLEMKVLFFHLLARCDLKPGEKTKLPLKLARDGFAVKAEGGFWLDVTARKNPHHAVAILDETSKS